MKYIVRVMGTVPTQFEVEAATFDEAEHDALNHVIDALTITFEAERPKLFLVEKEAPDVRRLRDAASENHSG